MAARLVGRRSGPPSRSALLLAYNVVTTGQVLHPAYDYLYHLEARGLPGARLPPGLGRRGSALPAPEPRDHVPRPPDDPARPRCPTRSASTTSRCARRRARQRGLFDAALPAGRAARHRDERPADEPGVPAADPGAAPLRPQPAGHRRGARGRSSSCSSTSCTSARAGSSSAIASATTPSPFALPLVALGMRAPGRRRRRWAMPLAMGLVVVSIAVNAWGVVWGGCSDGERVTPPAAPALVAPPRRRRRRVRRRLVGAAARARLLGHRRAPGRRAR